MNAVTGQRRPEVGGLMHDFQAREVPEPCNRRQLMLVAVLAQCGASRHHDHALAEFDSRDDGAHAGVRDDGVAGLQSAAKFLRVDLVRPPYMARLVAATPDLGEDLGVAVHARPVVQRPNQAVEG